MSSQNPSPLPSLSLIFTPQASPQMNYTKTTNFTAKDSLPSGNASKIIKGEEIDDEFDAIAVAVATKSDLASPTFTGTPAAPTAAVATDTTQLATTAFVHDILPAGVILMWSGSVASIPTGWQICDGTNSTPDLRNRFIVGAGSTYAVAATGGSADAIVVSHTHTATSGNQSTNHSHTFSGTTSSENAHSHTFSTWQSTGGGGASYPLETQGLTSSSQTTSTASAHTHTYSGTTGNQSDSHNHTITVASAGSSGTGANLPPYYALAYIMKTTG